MEKINIKKVELLQILKENLDLHREVYKEAMEAFKVNYQKRMTEMLTKAAKEEYDFYVNLTLPIKHSQDYRDAIKMVELEVNDIITLSHKEFCSYVLNKWDWAGNFEDMYVKNMGYSGYSGYSASAVKYFNK